MGVLDFVKGAWGLYWKVHTADAIQNWLDGTTYIKISESLDDEIGLSQKYWDDYTGVAPYKYKYNWSIWSLMEAAYHEASGEIKEDISALENWEIPEHMYITIPTKDSTREGPRFDLMKPAHTFGVAFGYIKLAIMSIFDSGIVGTIKEAILNINPQIVGTASWTYKDPYDGNYKTGYQCTPNQYLTLGDVASIYGLYRIL